MMQDVTKQADVRTDFKIEAAEFRASAPLLIVVSFGLPGLPGVSSMFGKKKKRLEISAPSNFEHRVHTGFDPREQKFTGLPQQWQSLLADTANRPKPMVDPSYITPIQLAPMKVEPERAEGVWSEHREHAITPSRLTSPVFSRVSFLPFFLCEFITSSTPFTFLSLHSV